MRSLYYLSLSMSLLALSFAHSPHEHLNDRYSYLLSSLPSNLLTSPIPASFLAVSIICMLPILILLVVPKAIPITIQRTLVAFGVGSLLGDAFLHLIPHVAGGNSHSHAHFGHREIENETHASDRHDHDITANLLMVAGFVGLMFIERVVGMVFGNVHHHHHHEHSYSRHQHSHDDSKKSEDLHNNKQKDTESDNESNDNEPKKDNILFKDGKYEEKDSQIRKRKPNRRGPISDTTTLNASSLHSSQVPLQPLPNLHHSLSHHSHHQVASPSSSAYLIIVANFIHSLTDGLLISISFYSSLSTGLSTSLAVFFHEIPHRIGDYFLLLSQNFSRSQSILAQVILCFGMLLGCVFGALVQVSDERLEKVIGGKVENLVMPVTAGCVVYVATVVVVPELLHGGQKGWKGISQLVLEMAALAIGVFVMAQIAMNE